MKKTLIFLLIMAGITISQAAILCVNNDATLPTQYQQIDTAIAAANPYDTIYINGSSASYGNFTITKSLTLIGAGTFAQKQNAFATKIGVITINSNLSDIVIEGFDLNQVTCFSKTNIHNVIIRNNRINLQLYFRSLSNSGNFLISSNVFETGQIDLWSTNNLSNFTIEHNIIMGDIYGMNVTNGLLSHNVFYNTTSAFTSSVVNAMIMDNIFFNSDPIDNAVGCTYLNNISYNSSGLLYSSMGAGNIDNTDPLFINVATSGVYMPSYNFNVQVTSPAHNAATDGTDMGVYGGNSNITLTGEVFNMPVIRSMLIQNTTVPQNGNVNVKVRSTKSRTN